MRRRAKPVELEGAGVARVPRTRPGQKPAPPTGQVQDVARRTGLEVYDSQLAGDLAGLRPYTGR